MIKLVTLSQLQNQLTNVLSSIQGQLNTISTTSEIFSGNVPDTIIESGEIKLNVFRTEQARIESLIAAGDFTPEVINRVENNIINPEVQLPSSTLPKQDIGNIVKDNPLIIVGGLALVLLI